MSGSCDGVRLRRRLTGWTQYDKQKKSLFNEAKQFTKNKVQKGQAESTGRTRNTDRTTEKGHGTRDDNPTGDKGKTDTIYREEHRCTTSDTNETRGAEGRCSELNN